MSHTHHISGSFGAALARFCRRFLADRRGAIAIFLAFAIIPLIGFIGIGTDTARAYLVKSRLSSALDSAGLAGGWGFYEATRDDDIRMFFNANFPAGYMDATVTGPAITADADNETITLSASAVLPTTFMRLFGFENLTVAVEAEVTRKMQALDMVLAIDMSGSMSSSASGGGSRIAAARNASTELINILFGTDSQKDLLNIGLVPWNGKVNVMLDGAAYDSAATTTQATGAFVNPENAAAQSEIYFANNSPVPLLSAPPADWQGCVFNRFIDDADDGSDADILLGPQSVPGADWVAWQPIYPGTDPTWGGEPVPGSAQCSLNVSGECRRCLDHGITPLQNQKQVILDAVAALVSPTGTTNIPQGLGWGWRVLKPDAPFTEAVANPDYDRQQAIVLLTDGENYGGSGDGYKTTFGGGGTARPDMDARLLALADNIKASGVIVYVIQFANGETTLQALLQQVASGPDSPYYHYAPDAATLQQIFREIANHLSQLRLSK